MKFIVSFVAAVLFLGMLPVGATGQGLCGPGMPMGVPGISACAPSCEEPKTSLFAPPTLFAGGMGTFKAVRFAFDPQDAGSLTAGDHHWPISGAWFGVEERLTFHRNYFFGAVLDAWWLLPFNRKAVETEDFSRTVLQFVGIVNRFPVFVPVTTTGTGGRTFDTRSDWWFADATAALGPTPEFVALGGFRYEHFSTRFKNPGNVVQVASNPADTADITFIGYLPFFGFEYRAGGILVRAIGLPYAPGRFEHLETGEAGNTLRTESRGSFKKSYWFELFAEAKAGLGQAASLGAFFRWNVLHGNLDLDTTVLNQSGQLKAAFDRNTWTLGGSLTLDLPSPF